MQIYHWITTNSTRRSMAEDDQVPMFNSALIIHLIPLDSVFVLACVMFIDSVLNLINVIITRFIIIRYSVPVINFLGCIGYPSVYLGACTVLQWP